MCNCIHKNCQYIDFFNDKEFIKNKQLYYVKDINITSDEYCIFHAPKELKSNFSYNQNELFRKIILEYIDFCKKENRAVDFSYSTFHIQFDIKNIDLKEEKLKLNLDFTKTIFLEYFRMDNLKCNELIFKNTEFHDGGGIKNRGGKEKVNITKLIFRPYQLESDFVIDMGKYANKDGLSEVDKYGIIKIIRFENHKKGSGIVYFIGLNNQLEEANFRNMILDNVSFQNCDLGKCYFLNAKVDITEFRNCEFPQVSQGTTLGVIDKSVNNDIFSLFIGLGLIIFLYLLGSGLLEMFLEKLPNKNIFYQVLQVTYVFIPIFVIAFIIPIFKVIYFMEFLFSNMILENKFQYINNIKTIHYHKGIADEVKITSKTGFTASLKNKIQMQETLSSIEAVYRQLKINFNKKDFQLSGDFFFSQRLMEVYSSKYKDNLIERSILIIHHGLNGFGEKFIKPAIFFIATLFIFTSIYISNEDFVVTEQTPQFLIVKTNDVNQSIPYYKNQIFKITKESNVSITKRQYIPQELDDDWATKFTYSASQFISPFTAKNRVWFKTVSSKAAILNIIETILLYIFFGAFLLAIKNRIKR